jgi:hypothetical protein
MQSQSSKKYTTVNTPYGKHSLSYDEYVRWLCLLEGIEFVGKRVDQLKARSQTKEVDWIKPLAFQKYIVERVDSMKSDLDELEKLEEIAPITIPCTTSQVPA